MLGLVSLTVVMALGLVDVVSLVVIRMLLVTLARA